MKIIGLWYTAAAFAWVYGLGCSLGWGSGLALCRGTLEIKEKLILQGAPKSIEF